MAGSHHHIYLADICKNLTEILLKLPTLLRVAIPLGEICGKFLATEISPRYQNFCRQKTHCDLSHNFSQEYTIFGRHSSSEGVEFNQLLHLQ